MSTEVTNNFINLFKEAFFRCQKVIIIIIIEKILNVIEMEIIRRRTMAMMKENNSI